MTTYNVADVRPIVERLIGENPNRVNPTADGYDVCLYTSLDGTEHCIVGQLLVELGLEAPEARCSMSAEVMLALKHPDSFTDGARHWLRRVQLKADGNHPYSRTKPVPWGLIFLPD